MDRQRPSRTSDIPVVMRAMHQTRDAHPKILDDPVAPKLVDAADLDTAWLAPMLDHPFAPQWRAGFLVRSRFAEDRLAAAARRGIGQYVILGAGLDTFAYRQPGWARAITIYEIDHPATQAVKRERLAQSGVAVPANLTFVPIDFETGALDAALSAAGFDSGRPTFCSWLGVTQYLTGTAIDGTLSFVLSLPTDSEIVFSFMLPQAACTGVEADALQIAAAKAAEAGEPWVSRFDPADLARKLLDMGFSEVFVLTPDAARERYLSNRHDGLTARQGEQSICAVV